MRALSAMTTGSNCLEANGLAPASSINLEDSGLPKVCLKLSNGELVSSSYRAPVTVGFEFEVPRDSLRQRIPDGVKPFVHGMWMRSYFKEVGRHQGLRRSVPPVGEPLCGQDVGGTTFGCTRYLLSVSCRKLTRANYTYPLATTLTLGPPIS